jgi:hypothetical protein
MVWDIEANNDEEYYRHETPEQRYARMLTYISGMIKEDSNVR